MDRVINRTGCLAKGVVFGKQMGQELLRLAQRARAEGKISDEDWQRLPSSPEGMVNLILSKNVEKGLINALLETYG